MQKKFKKKEDALKEFEELKKTHSRVYVILSKGAYYVETEPPFIRSWEIVIKTYEK